MILVQKCQRGVPLLLSFQLAECIKVGRKESRCLVRVTFSLLCTFGGGLIRVFRKLSAWAFESSRSCTYLTSNRGRTFVWWVLVIIQLGTSFWKYLSSFRGRDFSAWNVHAKLSHHLVFPFGKFSCSSPVAPASFVPLLHFAWTSVITHIALHHR